MKRALEMAIEYQISCPKWTLYVSVDSLTNEILDAAPLARKFLGQKLSALISWCERFGEVRVFVLDE